MSKYGVISGPYFPVFSPNTGKYGPEITPYLNTFYAVDSQNMDEDFLDFCIHQRSKRPRKQASKPSETTAKPKGVRTFFNKETLQLVLVPKKNYCD